MIWESDLPFYCNTFWLLVWTLGGVWLSGELGRENVLGACKVEGWGCCYVQSENPCFGTRAKLGITHKNLGLSLVPVAAHKHFPSPHHFNLHRSCSVHVLGRGTGRLRVLWHCLICTWAVTPPISSCWTLRLQLHVSSTAEVTAQGLTWVCRHTTNLTGEGELAEVSQLLSFSKWFSKNAWLHLSLPACVTWVTSTCRKAPGRELLRVSRGLLCQDNEVCKAGAV